MIYKSNKLENNLMIKTHNLHQMKTLLDLSVSRIVRQGSGCNVKDYGPAYRDPKTGFKDSIAIVSSIPNKYLDKHYGLISEDYQKPIVRHLSKAFLIDIQRDIEWISFIKFLQCVQDAHDTAFDYYNKFYANAYRMNVFLEKCKLIKKDFKL